MLDRRTFLASSTALGFLAFGGLPVRALAQAQPAEAQAAGERDAALDAMLDGWFREDLLDNPTFATNLGLDTGELAQLRGRLGESSLAEINEERAQSVERLRQIEGFEREGLSEAGRLNYDIAQFRWSVNAQGARFRYGSAGGRPALYVLSQLGGSYYGVPDFLDTQHPIGDRQDAEYYLDRVEDFARNLQQETERLRHDASLGVVAPDFILDKTIASISRLREGPAAESTLVRSLVRRTREQGIEGDWEARATALVSGPVAAGLDAQIALLRDLRTNAVHDAGVWRLPEGEAYYDWGIRANTTTTMTGDEIHRTGLEQVAELHAELDTMLKAQGYTQGSVGDRLNAMNEEERFLYPNTDAGRAELLAALNRQVEEITPRLPRMFNRIPTSRVQIRRVPVEIEIGAPGGYYQGASLDGSRPGAYYINLRDTHERPSLGLPTLSYHEAVPGHHFQVSLAREAGELPLYRRTQGFSAYNEGWALYAERVADELGVYEDDPFGRIGYLQSYLFRAVRLVVDSGMHHKRWSREQAVRYMVDNAAEPEGSAVREIERYCVWPGQACAYKIGQTVIANLRAEAERTMGERFDIKAFHDVVLLAGSMPLTVLERRVQDWMRTA
ncbi:DUF885 family protein [Sphingosinicella sp. CPCC 101087]|uniref:DUF885 domain-containing protein n=1 Tax=Sphingosinicella sp. CPCC 101087 TaxID=2497754 RepID=UPI001FB059AA|nr:DUF885 family protein [Sphingosinicella sp. CPCC 101087]